MHSYDGKQFNDAVADLFASVDGFLVRRRVKSFNKKRLTRSNGEDLGDVDVMIAVPSRRELIPVETKNLTAALSPSEMSYELKELFGDAAEEKGHIERFAQRVQWIKAHRKDVLAEMKVGTGKSDSWSVNPIIVLDRELFSSFFGKSNIPILSFRQIPQWSASRSSKR